MPVGIVEYADYIEEDIEKYDESADEDFNPESAPAEDASASSEDEDAPTKTTKRKGKRKAPTEDDGLDSGDEVTINAAKKRRAKKQKKTGRKDKNDGDEDFLSDDDGYEGGLIRTRAQRQVEKQERKPLAKTEGATVDVEALWAELMAAPLQPRPLHPEQKRQPDILKDQPTVKAPAAIALEDEEHIALKKTYSFAGQDTTEEKSVPRSQLDKYLSDGWFTATPEAAPAASTTIAEQDPKSRTRRPLHRPSRYDANTAGYVRTLAPEHQLFWPRKASATLISGTENIMPPPELPKAKDKTQKLNVVDKSRMDWTGFVDKEGIADELNTHGKTKESYLGRMNFLADVEAKKEEERKRARLSGMVS